MLCNSGKYNDLDSNNASNEILKDLDSIHMGKKTTNYRLRDWLISRQRYWGAPIPIVYCEHCGIVPVPENELPVELPYDVEFNPDGRSPLASCDEFLHTTCPKCGSKAIRETDTLDTFVCSSWYYLRYYDTKNTDKPWDIENVKKIMPVDMYVGGVEHAAMHLLYARFIYKALRDMEYVTGDEPFKKLIHQGVILGSDGQKMSKSKNNTILPDSYIHQYGSDIF
jgi:leucyl-tRNA synthetase